VKKLTDFPRPENDNGWGVHGSTNWQLPLGRPEHEDFLLGELQAMKMRWVKLLCNGDSADRSLEKLRSIGIMPIVRYIRERPNGYESFGFDNFVDGDDEARRKNREAIIRHEREFGVVYRELNNEPNYNVEWKNKTMLPFRHAVKECAEAYIKESRWCLESGCQLPPLVPAPTPTDGSIWGFEKAPKSYEQLDWENGGVTAYSDVLWLLHFLYYVADHAPDVVEAGIAIACHNAALNHPVDFPDDSINVEEWTHKGHKPDITQFWFEDGMPTGWSNCWRKYEAYDYIARKVFGESVPILSTEGGFWQWPADDPRYPPMSKWIQAERTKKAMLGMAVAPSYYFCTGHWCLLNSWAENPNFMWEKDAWYHGAGEHLPVVDTLKALEPLPRQPVVVEEPMIEMWRLRKWAYEAVGVELVVDSPLRRHARRYKLGAPLGPAQRKLYGDIWYEYQPYANGIVYKEREYM